jgi:methyl-accepting chemotaxis protein
MEELGASSRQSAKQADASAAGTHQALSLAEEGTLAVQQTMEGMSALKEKLGTSLRKFYAFRNRRIRLVALLD